MNGKLKIDLDKRIDSYGKHYYIGRIESPILIDCQKGISFLIFTSKEGEEQLQICNAQTKPQNKSKTPKIYKQIKKEIQNG